MKTICLANMKGGVGKTSISVTLATELGTYGGTMLLDFDPQANATSWTLPDDANPVYETVDLLQGKATMKDACIQTQTQGLSVIPTFGIGGGLKTYVENIGELIINKAVKRLLIDIGRQGYRFCVIDMSPAFGKLERAALIAADEVITPILADRFSMDGLQTIATNIADLRDLVDRPIAQYKRIVINGLDKRIKRHQEITEQVRAQMPQMIYTLPIDQVFFRAQTASHTVQSMDAKKETLDEITRLAKDITEA